jgi:4-aminobutyrate aminotransferase-like enzyme/Ser/Thr protein kinase RdoA (MazF antagonist)
MSKNNNRIHFSEEEIKKMTLEFYGLQVSVTSLVSYSDWNFLLKTNQGERYVLKIANEREPRNFLDAQNKMMEFLAEQNYTICCPRVCKTGSGASITEIVSTAGTHHFLRMLTYLPGNIMGDVCKQTHSLELMENIGAFLGSMDKTLATFQHPALYRYIIWDPRNCLDLIETIEHIDDTEQRNLVHHFLLQFQSEAISLLPKLPMQVIHNDANDYNLLVNDELQQATGLIDFGDIVFTSRISELAIAIAYAIHYKEDPLATAAALTRGYHNTYPLNEEECKALFYFITARLCTTVAISMQQLKLNPDNKYLNISVKPALDALKQLVTVDPNQAENMFRNACGFKVKEEGLEPAKIVTLREKYLGKSLSVSYKQPIKMVRGYMQYLFDETGRTYLDTVNNVCHVGHCHPRVVAAAQGQMGKLNTNTRYLHDNIIQYAMALSDTLPDPLNVCFFVCTGSEANELALRMARTFTGNRDFVVVDHAYHGNTNAIIEISPYKFDGPGGSGPAPHIHKTMMPDPYRGKYKSADPEAGSKYAKDVARAFKELQQNGRKAAAFIHESVPGVAGQIVLPDNYLKEAYGHARNAGAVCIADEVQIGFGRVGSHMWAFETHGVIPDIVTMGKPIGNGHPLAAVVTTTEIADAFNNGMEYFNTFGGNPVSCTTGLEVLKVIKDEKLQENAFTVGQYLKKGLTDQLSQYPIVGDVRGIGLFIGIELVKDHSTLEPAKEEAYFIAEAMKEEGILISVDGPLHNVLKFKPPIQFNKQNANQYIETMDRILRNKGAAG